MDYQEQLKQEIISLNKGITGMIEVDKNLRESFASRANTYIALSSYANYAKLQILLRLFNNNFNDPEMKNLEKTINSNLKIQEDSLLEAYFYNAKIKTAKK